MPFLQISLSHRTSEKSFTKHAPFQVRKSEKVRRWHTLLMEDQTRPATPEDSARRKCSLGKRLSDEKKSAGKIQYQDRVKQDSTDLDREYTHQAPTTTSEYDPEDLHHTPDAFEAIGSRENSAT